MSKLTEMDVDSSSTQSNPSCSSLKRCSSAPMINEINNKMNTSPTPSPSSREPVSFNHFTPSCQPRTRRFSASFSPLSASPNSGPRLTPRVSQLRQEESADVSNIREVAHEREIHSAMQMSQSWEDLTLVGDCKTESTSKDNNCRMLPLHVTLPTGPPLCSSPSPTRPGFTKQVFSPGVHMSWKPLMSPSPTRRSFTRRSLSPIAMRPSSLGQVKRKFELDEDKTDQYLTPPTKRITTFHPVADRGGLLMAHNNTSSPLPGSLSSIGTPESLSSADSPGFTFHSVDSPSPNRHLLGNGDEPMNEDRAMPDLNNKSQQAEAMATTDNPS